MAPLHREKSIDDISYEDMKELCLSIEIKDICRISMIRVFIHPSNFSTQSDLANY